MKSILVTGSNGMLGKQVVKALLDAGYSVTGVSTGKDSDCQENKFTYISMDLTNPMEVERLFRENAFTHVIHLAAIAHVLKGAKISWSRYYRVNTMMSSQIFESACKAEIPVFFASTVDVYGITNKIINEKSQANPIGDYARSKYLAEKSLSESGCQSYLIARFAPIYTEDDLRDIHRRYYIRFPKLCYLIGNGMEYEFLSSRNAVALILKWVSSPETMTGIVNVCDSEKHNTKELIQKDKEKGLANRVLWIPEWLKGVAGIVVNIVFFKNPLLKFSAYKIIAPMRIDSSKLNNL